MEVTHAILFVTTVLVAGVLGGVAMEAVMWLITRTGWTRGNMIVAVGSLISRSRENAWRVGVAVHTAAAVFFAAAYVVLMITVDITTLPATLAVGLGIGFVHGLLVSLGLVWVVSDEHPLAEFRGADFAIGVSHLAGHLAFGLVVGLVVGIVPL